MKAKSSRTTASMYSVAEDNREQMDTVLSFVLHQIIRTEKVRKTFFFFASSRPSYLQSILISSLYLFFESFAYIEILDQYFVAYVFLASDVHTKYPTRLILSDLITLSILWETEIIIILIL
jgi:hypothetical protein